MVRNKQRDNLARVLRFPDGKLESPDFDSGYLGVDDKTPVVDLGIDDKTPVMGFDPNSITPISSIEYDEVERYMSRQPVLQRKDKNRKIEFDSDDKRKYFGLIGLLDVVRVELKNRRNKSFENITRNDKTIASVLETKLTAYSLITGSNSVSELCDWYSSISDLGDLAELKKVIYYKLESVISKCEDIDSLTDARVHILDLVNNSKGIIGMDLENLVKVLDQKIDYSIPLFTEELFYRMGRKEVVDKDFVESEGEKEFWEAFPLLDSGLNNMSDEDTTNECSIFKMPELVNISGGEFELEDCVFQWPDWEREVNIIKEESVDKVVKKENIEESKEKNVGSINAQIAIVEKKKIVKENSFGQWAWGLFAAGVAAAVIGVGAYMLEQKETFVNYAPPQTLEYNVNAVKASVVENQIVDALKKGVDKFEDELQPLDESSDNLKPIWEDLSDIERKKLIVKYFESLCSTSKCGSKYFDSLEEGVINQEVTMAGYNYGADWKRGDGNSIELYNKAGAWLRERGVVLDDLGATKDIRGAKFNYTQVNLDLVDVDVLRTELIQGGFISKDLQKQGSLDSDVEKDALTLLDAKYDSNDSLVNYDNKTGDFNWETIDNDWDDVFAEVESVCVVDNSNDNYYEEIVIEYVV